MTNLEDSIDKTKQSLELILSDMIQGRCTPADAIEAILALLSKEITKARTQGVAWTIRELDDMHMHDTKNDHLFKGIKNRLRDTYKTGFGVDPAPNYPIKQLETE